MIHRNDERVFRFIEISAYVGLIVAASALRVRSLPESYAFPMIFLAAGFAGIMYMTRFFIYEYPERVWDRRRAVCISIPRSKKVALGLGCTMCIPLLILGSVGLHDLRLMNRLITALSPFTWLFL